MSDITASRLVTERLVKEIEEAGEKVEFIATGAAERLEDGNYNLTTFGLQGITNRYTEESKDMWLMLFGKILMAKPEVVDTLAAVGVQLDRSIQTVHVPHKRQFWAVALTSLRDPEGGSAVRIDCLYSDNETAQVMSARGWAVEAFWQAMLGKKTEEFGKLGKILAGEPVDGPSSRRIH